MPMIGDLRLLSLAVCRNLIQGEFVMNDINSKDRIAVRMAFNKIKRFEITDIRDLKAGLYVNLRATPRMSCCLVEARWFHGVPKKLPTCDATAWKLPGARLAFQFDENGNCLRYDDPTHYHYVSMQQYHCVKDEFVDTWIKYNRCFKYNTRVMQVITALRNLPHWEQFAIIRDMPFTLQTQERFNDIAHDDIFSLDPDFYSRELTASSNTFRILQQRNEIHYL